MERPHVIINCAMTADGKIALPNKKQLRISSDEDIRRMYKLRNDCDAVLVGINTILTDDPKLTVKEKYIKNPKQPIRVILDSKCRTPLNALAVNNYSETIIMTGKKCIKKFPENVEIIQCKLQEDGLIDLQYLLKILYDKGIKTLMIEGGSSINWSFLKEKLVDELFVYLGPIVVGGKNTPTLVDGIGIKNINELISLEITNIKRLGNGIIITYKMIL